MKDHEYELLEDLLGKLHRELGFQFCLIDDFIQDSFYIGQYDKKGENIRGESGPDLKSLVAKYKSPKP